MADTDPNEPEVVEDLPSGVPAAVRVEAGPVCLAVRSAGDEGSHPLVLLHGLTATAGANWMHLFEPLAEQGWRVMAPDLRGHGRTRAEDGISIEQMADDVAAMLDHYDIERAVVGGFSMGGAVAQTVWQRHPDRVEGLALLSTAMRFQLAPIGANLYGLTPAMARLGSNLPDGVRSNLVAKRIPLDDATQRAFVLSDVGASSPLGVAASARALRGWRSKRWIGGVDVPATVVVTTEDGSLAPKAQRALAATVPDAEVVELAGPHAAVMWRPDSAVPVVVEALDGLRSRVLTRR